MHAPKVKPTLQPNSESAVKFHPSPAPTAYRDSLSIKPMQLVGGAGGRGEGAVAFGAVELGSDKAPENHSSAFRLVIRQSTIVAPSALL